MLYQRGKAYSQDLRERVFEASDDGERVGEWSLARRTRPRGARMRTNNSSRLAIACPGLRCRSVLRDQRHPFLISPLVSRASAASAWSNARLTLADLFGGNRVTTGPHRDPATA